MPIEKLRPSYSFNEERLKEMKKVVPEVFADGKINWEVLRESLGEYVEDESGAVEHFGLFWPGKSEARKIASIPSKGTLVPIYGEGLKADGTSDKDRVNDSNNIFIEGENLEVLKILQKSYANRIKMIYIDPPYNTGNDFVYDDNFVEPLEEYLRRTGQIDSEGKPLTTNKKVSGRYHSKWLTMMYPRLKLARNILCDDGVIFISIDDNEIHNLRLLCDEVFGEENFIAVLTLLCNPKGRAQDKHFAANHEYILVYSKNPLSKGSFLIEKEKEQIENEYNEEDEFGKYRSLELRNTHREFGRHNRKNLFYPLYINTQTAEVTIEKHESSIEVLPLWSDGYEGCWTWGKEKAENEINLLIGKKVNETWKIYVKDYANGASKMLKTILIDKDFYTEKGQRTFNALFDSNKKIFPSPKSKELLMTLIKLATTGNDIIMDFFAGSGTLAHAVLSLNRQDNNQRRFICVQMPEITDEKSEAKKAGFNNIAEIACERIKRAIKKETLTGGFRYYSLKESNIGRWNNSLAMNIKEVETLFKSANNSLKPNWDKKSLLAEILLIEGFPIDCNIKMENCFKVNNIQIISSDLCEHKLIVCFDEKIENETTNKITIGENNIFICLDSAISDQDKLRLADKGMIKTI